MKPLQQIELELSEVRQALSAYAEDPSKGDFKELEVRYQKLEERKRAALLAGQEEAAPKTAPPKPLMDRVRLTEYVSAAMAGSLVKGAEAELRSELHLSDTEIPVDLILPPDVELRADVHTPAPSEVPQSQSAIVPRRFPKTAAKFLGVSMPRVPAGTRSYVYMSGGVSPSMVSAGSSKDAEAGAFTTQELSPVALQARYLFRREDTLLLSGMESALRRDLGMALSDEMDKQILEGNGTAPNVNGIFNALTAPTAETTTDTFATFCSKLYGAVDGTYASTEGDVKLLLGTATLRRAGRLFATNTATSALTYLRSHSGGVSSSAHITAPASNVQDGVAYRAGGSSIDAVAPIWQAASVIVDPYTGAATREVSLTMVVYWNFAVVRSAPYTLISYLLA